MRVYLSGPITNVLDLNRSAFTEAAAKLRELGHDVVNPLELPLEGEREWEYYLRHDLIAMLQRCDAIALLPGWQKSKGSQIEYLVADALHFTRIVL